MKVEFCTKEIHLIKNYVDEMLDLFNEKDMINENESIYLPKENIFISKKDLENLNRKLIFK